MFLVILQSYAPREYGLPIHSEYLRKVNINYEIIAAILDIPRKALGNNTDKSRNVSAALL